MDEQNETGFKSGMKLDDLTLSPASEKKTRSYDSQRGSINKKLVIGLCSAALIAAGIGAYFAFFKNKAPVIADQEPIPPELYIGETFNIRAKVTDDEGVKEVLGVIQEPDGTVKEIVLYKSNGSWGRTCEVTKEGNHEIYIKATDIKGKEATRYAGRTNGMPDNPPEII